MSPVLLFLVTACNQSTTYSNVNVTCKLEARVAQDTTSEESGDMKTSTAVFIGVATVCFVLLLLGFSWVAWWRAQPTTTPAPSVSLRTNANSQQQRPRGLPDISEPSGLWAGWIPVQKQLSISAPSIRQTESQRSGATSSFAATHVTQDMIDDCRISSYDLDDDLTEGITRILRNSTLQHVGHPGGGCSALEQGGNISDMQKDERGEDSGTTGSLSAAVGGAVSLNFPGRDTVETGR
ncbi:hypothetical protein V8B97DRAFT_1919309 [Scleroderma yunnanense]